MHRSKETRHCWVSYLITNFFLPQSFSRMEKVHNDFHLEQRRSRENHPIVKNSYKWWCYLHEFSIRRADEWANLDDAIIRFNLWLPIALFVAVHWTLKLLNTSHVLHIRPIAFTPVFIHGTQWRTSEYVEFIFTHFKCETIAKKEFP